MDNLESMDKDVLVNQYILLYKQLLELSEQQVHALVKVTDDELPDEFITLQEQWNEKAQEIDSIQLRISKKFAVNYSTPKEVEEIITSCIYNIEKVEQHLLKFKAQLSGGFQNVRNQRTVVNAYYGINLKETSPMYFDKKN